MTFYSGKMTGGGSFSGNGITIVVKISGSSTSNLTINNDGTFTGISRSIVTATVIRR